MVEKRVEPEDEERKRKEAKQRKWKRTELKGNDGGWNGGAWKEKEDTVQRERAARHAVKYGFTADTYRDVYIASQPRNYAPLSRRCWQPTGHRAERCLRSLARR